MSSAFDRRCAVSKEFETELAQWLTTRSSVQAVAANGTEHTHPQFVAMIRTNSSRASKFVRYAPDGVMMFKGDVVHYDAKVGKSIEKDAYETYMGYVSLGCTVRLFVKSDGVVYQQNVDLIRLIDGNDTVAPFPPSLRYPVDSDGWICPRSSQRGACTDRMSGTPYKEIDFSSMRVLVMDEN